MSYQRRNKHNKHNSHKYKSKHGRKKLSNEKMIRSIPKDDMYYQSTNEGSLKREMDQGEVMYKWYIQKTFLIKRAQFEYNMFIYNSGAHILLNGLRLKGINLGPDLERVLTDYIIMFAEATKIAEWDCDYSKTDIIDSMYFIAKRSANFKKN
jgi:hypothetical protein